MRSFFAVLILIALFHFQEIESSRNTRTPKPKRTRRRAQDDYVDPAVYANLIRYANNNRYIEPDFMSSQSGSSSSRPPPARPQQTYQNNPLPPAPIRPRPIRLLRPGPNEYHPTQDISSHLAVTPRTVCPLDPQQDPSWPIMPVNSAPQQTQPMQDQYASLRRHLNRRTFIQPTFPINPHNFQDPAEFNFEDLQRFDLNQPLHNPDSPGEQSD